jgi:hypothetical protein
MTADIVSICRHLAGLHGGTDLPERVRTALDTQREQRVALAQAADVMQRQASEIATLKARVLELELTLSDDGRDPTDCKDSGAAA